MDLQAVEGTEDYGTDLLGRTHWEQVDPRLYKSNGRSVSVNQSRIL